MADEKKTGTTTSLAPSEKGSPPDSTIATVDFAIGTTDILKHSEKSSISEKGGRDDYHHKPEEQEVFGNEGEGQVNFRTVGWIRASMFLMKQTFATGVLSMPSAMYYLGGVMSPLFIVFWGLVNTYSAIIQGNFKLAHPKMHTIIDGAEIAVLDLSGSRFWSKIAKFVAEVLYLMSWLLCIGLAVLAIGTALNAVTKHGACTVAFNVVAMIVSIMCGSIRKIHGLGIILWIGFVSALVSVLTVVIAVAIRKRPAYAPQTGPYDLGFQAGPPPGTTFAQAWAGAIAVYASSSNTCGYIPVMSEMRRPQDFFRALYISATFVNTAYLSLATVMYAYAGKYVTSPALGSAGPTIKIAAYAVALPGLIAVGMICVHVPAKTIFVRILRGTHHLTENTKTHWIVWIACTIGCGFVGWLLAVAIPFYTSLVSLIGSMGFGPLGIVLPPILWFSLHPEFRTGTLKEQGLWWAHVGMLLLGLLLSIGGTYANISNIADQFRAGKVGTAFSCADNSATVVGG